MSKNAREEMLNFKVKSIETFLGIPFEGESYSDKEKFVERHYAKRMEVTKNLLLEAFEESKEDLK